MLQATATLSERRIEGGSQELVLTAPALTQMLAPGQPLLAKMGWGTDPHLRRTLYPIAIADETLSVRLPPSADRGLAWLRMAPIGSELDCLGPVGRGFALPDGARNVLCLGEAEWSWVLLPLVGLADAAGRAVTLAVQSPSTRAAIPAQRLPFNVEYHLSTPEGRRESRWRLQEHLPELIGWADAVMLAGSLAFYRAALDQIVQTRVAFNRGFAQALYPASFLCGFGACFGCVADVAGGRRRVCLRGPVFDLVDVFRA